MLMHPSEHPDKQFPSESSDTSAAPTPLASPAPQSGKAVDLCYCRSFCAMCNRALRYLKARTIPVQEIVSAEKRKLGPDDALAMARRASHVWVTRGDKLHHFDMKAEPPTDSELLRVMLAPSGNLRAPALVSGEHLIVGFDEDAFRRVFDK